MFGVYYNSTTNGMQRGFLGKALDTSAGRRDFTFIPPFLNGFIKEKKIGHRKIREDNI